MEYLTRKSLVIHTYALWIVSTKRLEYPKNIKTWELARSAQLRLILAEYEFKSSPPHNYMALLLAGNPRLMVSKPRGRRRYHICWSSTAMHQWRQAMEMIGLGQAVILPQVVRGRSQRRRNPQRPLDPFCLGPLVCLLRAWSFQPSYSARSRTTLINA